MKSANSEQTQLRSGHPWLRRSVIFIVGLLTLVAAFYTVENWRGKREWQRARGELEAQGVIMDWAKYIPPAVPDDQNIFKAPKMSQWFVGRGTPKGAPSLGYSEARNCYTNAIGLITVMSANAPASKESDIVLDYEGPNVTTAQARELKKLIQSALGPFVMSPLDYLIAAKPLDQIKPVRIGLRTDSPPSVKELNRFISNNVGDAIITGWRCGNFSVTSNSPNSFQLMVNPSTIYRAKGFLDWSTNFDADLALIQEALKRPFARMEGNYEQPMDMPIPNFVFVRSLAQFLAQRAQSHLLMGQPDEALRDLTFYNDLGRLLEAKPTGKPMTLVAAMINVAIKGLYAQIIADGMRLEAWREPQLAALQDQLKPVNLPPLTREGLCFEQVSNARLFETGGLGKLAKLLADHAKDPRNTPTIERLRLFALLPRGWAYQNIATRASWMQGCIDAFDTTTGMIKPGQAERVQENIRKLHLSPYNYLALQFMPNFTRAIQTTALNQTLINEAYVACALERYHLAHQQYPETLAALVPQFAQSIPCDIFGGQPLHYRKTDNGNYLLYSIGWNEKDDGGQHQGEIWNNQDQGDIVWQDLIKR